MALEDLKETIGNVIGTVSTAADAAGSAYSTFYGEEEEEEEETALALTSDSLTSALIYALAGIGVALGLAALFRRKG